MNPGDNLWFPLEVQMEGGGSRGTASCCFAPRFVAVLLGGPCPQPRPDGRSLSRDQGWLQSLTPEVVAAPSPISWG